MMDAIKMAAMDGVKLRKGDMICARPPAGVKELRGAITGFTWKNGRRIVVLESGWCYRDEVTEVYPAAVHRRIQAFNRIHKWLTGVIGQMGSIVRGDATSLVAGKPWAHRYPLPDRVDADFVLAQATFGLKKHGFRVKIGKRPNGRYLEVQLFSGKRKVGA